MFYVRRLRFRLINYGKITNTEAKDHCHGVTQVSRTDRQTDGRTIDGVETLSLSSQGDRHACDIMTNNHDFSDDLDFINNDNQAYYT